MKSIFNSPALARKVYTKSVIYPRVLTRLYTFSDYSSKLSSTFKLGVTK